jgi:hypothetical protein
MNDKKALIPTVILMTALFYILVAAEWMIYNGLMDRNPDNLLSSGIFTLYEKLVPHSISIRLITCILIALTFWVVPNIKINKDEKEENRIWIHATTFVLCGLYIMGFRTFSFYSFFIFPLITFAAPYFIMKSVSGLNKLKDKSYALMISCLPENEMSFEFDTDLGLLRLHSPQQGIYVESGAGGGKSFNIIEPVLFEAVMKGYAGFVYDFKGNPPTLSRTVYSALKHKIKILKPGETQVKFGFINFVDMTRTVQVNPFSPKYLLSDLHVTEAATTLMLNLNKSWIEKRDFWADNAISILDAAIKFMKKHHPDKCTLPHVISLILNNYEGLLNLLATDPDIQKVILPVLVAHQKNAAGQTAGAISSIQLPLQKLYNANVYWVLSKDDFDLDLNNKNNPKFLCVANDPALMEALSPCIALITSVCMQQMNQQGKNKSIFCIDELPTLFINKLDNLPATARSNKVVTCLSVQSYAQLERDYGTKNAEVILGNLGNQFFGMTNEYRTAERVVKTFGDHKVRDFSFSESDSGLSESHSYKKENIFQARDVMGQQVGHFMGKVAGGTPPLFSVQMPAPGKRRVDAMEELTIPAFSVPMENVSESVNKTVLDKMVMENFERINAESLALIHPFIPVKEEKTVS